MHGTLNDFVVFDNRGIDIEHIAAFARFGTFASFGRYMCDRHAAIGADGLLVLENSAIADVRMRVINADGSEAEMCGNGIRCVVRYLAEEKTEMHGYVSAPKRMFRIETVAGIIETSVIAREPAFLVRAMMGVPVIERKALPVPDAMCVSLGNPHVVIFESEAIDAIDLPGIAISFQNSMLFPDGTNVHVAAKIGERMLTVRHWERGVGETMSCGTGAVACAVAAIQRGLVQSPVEVRVPGGTLMVEWGGSGVAYLTGPAVRVFDANISLTAQ